MGKKTLFTNITPLPPQVSREVAIAMLHNHDEMIELNPLVIEHHPINTPRDAPKDEFLDCTWQEMTDRIQAVGGIVSRKVTYKGCFHNLPDGLQTHVYAPMGLHIRETWRICGALPGEPDEPRELGLNTPRRGLYLREDGEMKCNIFMTGYVRKNLDHAHKVLVDRILAKAARVQAHLNNSPSESRTPQSSTRSAIPAFQPGSHMSNSSMVRQMTSPIQQTSSRDSSSLLRAKTDSPTVTDVRSPLRQDRVQELAGSGVEEPYKPLPRQPREDEDDAEMATIHPALREQYRQSRGQDLGRQNTVLPAYQTLSHQNGQYYHEDMAKRVAGKQFSAELEGSHAFDSAESSVSGQNRQEQQISEMGPSEPSSATGLFRTRTIYGESKVYDDPLETNGVPSHIRSQSQPVIQQESIPSATETKNYTLDRFSIVSGISDMPTPKPGQQAWGSALDNRFSVVSAITDVPTPKFQQQSFAQQQRQRQQRPDDFF